MGIVLLVLLSQVDAGVGLVVDPRYIGVDVIMQPLTVGLDPTEALYAECPVAPPAVRLDGGWSLLPPERAARIACLLETCDSSRKSEHKLNEGPQGPAWWATMISSFSFGASLATGAVLLGQRIMPPAAPPAP